MSPHLASEAFSKAAVSWGLLVVSVCQSMSSRDAARYSTVAKPCPKVAALFIFATRASGITSPVL